MKKQLLHFVICIAGLFPAKTLYARQTVIASGANATGSCGNVSRSIGQVAFITAVGANASINQGVQHPYEFYSVESENPQTIPRSSKAPHNSVGLNYSILQITTTRTTTSAVGSVAGLSPSIYTIGVGGYNSGAAIHNNNNNNNNYMNGWVTSVN